MIIKEVFKDIPNYVGLYQISNLGNVKSLPKGDGNGYQERFLKLDGFKSKRATYYRVSLCKKGKVERFLIHRLVATVFIPNPDSKPQVNHIDHNTANNAVTNLEWVTAKENMAASTLLGRQEKPRELGQIQASKNNQTRAEDKFSKLLGNRYINTFTKKNLNGATKRFVTYKCICGNIYTERSDNVPLRLRKGICNQCKDEDIV